MKPAELRTEELTLKKFGFVPQDFDLKKTTIDLLTEQTAAFYDFHRKKLYITEWAVASNCRMRRWCMNWRMRWRTRTFSLEKLLRRRWRTTAKHRWRGKPWWKARRRG